MDDKQIHREVKLDDDHCYKNQKQYHKVSLLLESFQMQILP